MMLRAHLLSQKIGIVPTSILSSVRRALIHTASLDPSDAAKNSASVVDSAVARWRLLPHDTAPP